MFRYFKYNIIIIYHLCAKGTFQREKERKAKKEKNESQKERYDEGTSGKRKAWIVT